MNEHRHPSPRCRPHSLAGGVWRRGAAVGRRGGWGSTYHGAELHLLPQKAFLRQGVSGVVGDGVHGALLHLVLDGLEQQEEGRPGVVLWAAVTEMLAEGNRERGVSGLCWGKEEREK